MRNIIILLTFICAGCCNASRISENASNCRRPFTVIVYYENGDIDRLRLTPRHTLGDETKPRLEISTGEFGGGDPVLICDWECDVNGTVIGYRNTIASGVRRFEVIAN